MGRFYAQATQNVFYYAASAAAGASISGSVISQGYVRLIGAFATSDSTAAGSGLRIEQSLDGGSSWDITSASNGVANNGISACSTVITGNAVRVWFKVGATAASRVRANFYLQVI